jgi:hypothetical protein
VRQRPEAALTPRPLRLLLVGRVRPGAEPALREVQARFPLDAAAEAGIDAVEAFIGSGQYAVQLEIGRTDVQRVLTTFFNDPRVRAFRDKLEPVTEGLPGPDYQFGTAEQQASGQTIYNAGNLHFAASMYRWRMGQEPQAGDEPQGRAGKTSAWHVPSAEVNGVHGGVLIRSPLAQGSVCSTGDVLSNACTMT